MGCGELCAQYPLPLSGPLELPVSGLLNGLTCRVQFLEPGSLDIGKRKSCDVAMDLQYGASYLLVKRFGRAVFIGYMRGSDLALPPL